MTNTRRLLVSTWIGVLGLLLAASPVQANEVEFDRHVVHYTVLSTHFLSPEVARAYDLRRSRSRALVNVVIMERDGETLRPVSGKVSGQAVNLNRQVRHLRFREVRDGDAFYHLAEVPIRPGEVVDFRLHVTAAGGDEVMPVNFRHAFYHY
jgi:hypothetical protein